MVTKAAINQNGNGSGQDDPPVPYWTARQVFIATLVVLSVIFGFWLLYRFRLVVFGLFEAIVFATALRPAVDWLQRRGIPRALGAAIVFTLVTVLLVGMVVLFVPLFTEQGGTVSATLIKYYQNFRSSLLSTGSILITRLALRLPETLVIVPPGPAPTDPNAPLDRVAVVLSYGTQTLHGIFTTLTVLLLTYYWTIDRDRIVRSILIFFPAPRRDPAREFIEASENKVGAYLRGLAIMCGTIGLMSFVSYVIIGLPYKGMLAVTAGIMEAVPLLGPILGAVPAALMALALDPNKVVYVIIATVVIQQFENHLLVPRVMDQAVGVNPVVSLLAFVIFSSLFGIAGALLAVPLAATIQLIFNRTLIEVNEPPPVGRNTISMLRYEAQELIQDVRKQVREKDTALTDPSDQVEDAIEAIVNDLDSILAVEEKEQVADDALQKQEEGRA